MCQCAVCVSVCGVCLCVCVCVHPRVGPAHVCYDHKESDHDMCVYHDSSVVRVTMFGQVEYRRGG